MGEDTSPRRRLRHLFRSSLCSNQSRNKGVSMTAYGEGAALMIALALIGTVLLVAFVNSLVIIRSQPVENRRATAMRIVKAATRRVAFAVLIGFALYYWTDV